MWSVNAWVDSKGNIACINPFESLIGRGILGDRMYFEVGTNFLSVSISW